MHIDKLEEYPILEFFDQDSMTDHCENPISSSNLIYKMLIFYL